MTISCGFPPHMVTSNGHVGHPNWYRRSWVMGATASILGTKGRWIWEEGDHLWDASGLRSNRPRIHE